MKIDFTVIMRELDTGAPIPDAQASTKDKNVPLTLKAVAYRALLAQFQDEPADGERSYRRYKVASKILDAEDPTEVELTTEEVADLKKLIGKGWSPVVVGCAWDEIESVRSSSSPPPPAPPKAKSKPHNTGKPANDSAGDRNALNG